VIGWVLATLLASTALMLLVLLVRRPVAAAFGARVAYALWLLPVLRLVLPPLPGWTPPWLTASDTAPIAAAATPDPVAAATLAETTLSAVPTLADPAMVLLPLLALVWAAGGLLWFGWQMRRYRRFVGHVLGDAVALPPVGAIAVLASPAVAGPLAAGIRHRRIFVPADFATRYSADERRLALAHESAHHARGDLLANLVGLVVLALHWWNPVAHWAWAAFRADQELACDATVLAAAGPEHRLAYGRAVLKSACGATPAAACAMNHKTQLKQRIVMMKAPPVGIVRLFAGSVSAVALAGAGLLLTASGSAPPPLAPLAPLAPVKAATPPAAVPPPAPVAPRATAVAPAPPAPPAAPHVIIIKDGKLVMDGQHPGSDVRVIEAGDGARSPKQVKTIIMTRSEGDAPAAAGEKRLIMRCIKTVRIENGKSVTREAPKDCDAADLPEIDLMSAGAMQQAGVEIAMIKPTIESTLRRARAEIAGNSDLSADQRARALAGIDTAIKETLQDKPSAK
jgi:beta-lactamase regulating signal transducer with metallopeptidase domain